jgi:hypothetical protein
LSTPTPSSVPYLYLWFFYFSPCYSTVYILPIFLVSCLPSSIRTLIHDNRGFVCFANSWIQWLACSGQLDVNNKLKLISNK